jgi:hypothetical protein
MNDYPRQDKKITLYLSDDTQLTGLINIAGRGPVELVEDVDPDIVLYSVESGDGKLHQTVLVSKKQIVWINPLEGEKEKPEVGTWQKVRFKLVNGQEITGEVDISGYSRVSDYFQAFSRGFYELYRCSTEGKMQNLLLISSGHVLWRELVD